MEFSEKLQIEIRNSGHTNKEFAKRSGIVKTALNKILCGKKPEQWNLEKIAKGLNISIEDIRSWMPLETKKLVTIRKKFKQVDFKKNNLSPLKAKGRFCVRCLFKYNEYVYDGVEMAHYTGFRQMSFGKGTGKKVSDILKCPICKDCHNYFDVQIEYKSVDKSEEFLFFIGLFVAQEFELGNIIIK